MQDFLENYIRIIRSLDGVGNPRYDKITGYFIEPIERHLSLSGSHDSVRDIPLDEIALYDRQLQDPLQGTYEGLDVICGKTELFVTKKEEGQKLKGIILLNTDIDYTTGPAEASRFDMVLLTSDGVINAIQQIRGEDNGFIYSWSPDHLFQLGLTNYPKGRDEVDNLISYLFQRSNLIGEEAAHRYLTPLIDLANRSMKNKRMNYFSSPLIH